jgi:hypothetical protein
VPSRRAHIAQAEHNEALCRAIGGSQYADWAVTALFYAALHLVDAYLAPNVHPKTHTVRRGLVDTVAGLRPIRDQYRELEERSRDARYKCIRFTPAAVKELRSVRFEPLKAHLRALLGI